MLRCTPAAMQKEIFLVACSYLLSVLPVFLLSAHKSQSFCYTIDLAVVDEYW